MRPPEQKSVQRTDTPFTTDYLDVDHDGFVSECEFVDQIHAWLGGYDPAARAPGQNMMGALIPGEEAYNAVAQDRLVTAMNAVPSLTEKALGQAHVSKMDLNAFNCMCGPDERINQKDLAQMYKALRLSLYKSGDTGFRSWGDYLWGEADTYYTRQVQAAEQKGDGPCAYQAQDKRFVMIENTVLDALLDD